jgi:hypothetical protein
MRVIITIDINFVNCAANFSRFVEKERRISKIFRLSPINNDKETIQKQERIVVVVLYVPLELCCAKPHGKRTNY